MEFKDDRTMKNRAKLIMDFQAKNAADPIKEDNT